MKERPILFQGEMVRALLAGTKTQTRRVGEIQNPEWTELGVDYIGHATKGVEAVATYRAFPKGGSARWGICACPYGVAGDRLWVREDHIVIGHESVGPSLTVRYCADGAVKHCAVTPREYALFRARKSAPGSVVRGRFSYRSIARFVIDVVSVRVERLKAITEADAKAEGVVPAPENHTAAAVAYIFGAKEFLAHTSAYVTLWEQINGPGSWALNPWVWVIEFRRVTPAP